MLEATYLAALNDLIENAGTVVDAIKEGAELAMEPENRAALAQIEEDIIGIQESVLALHRDKKEMRISAAEYAEKVKEYGESMKAKEIERDKLQNTAVKFAEVRTWLDTFMEQAMQGDALTQCDGTVMKALVERIIAHDTGIEVVFRCGVTVEHEYVH